MREATLFDSPINKRHNLVELVEKHGSALPMGRTALIKVGEGSDNPNVPKVSRMHSSVIYDAIADTFTYADFSSNNGSRINRGKLWIYITKEHPKEVLVSGDQIYFSKVPGTGYGPVIFRQGNEEKQVNDADATQLVDN